MDLDPDTFLTTVYVEIDTFCAQHPAPVRRGPHPRMSDSEVLTVMLVGQWHGTSERGTLAWIAQTYHAAFPVLLSPSAFNRRARRLAGLVTTLLHDLAQRLAVWEEWFEIVDGLPVPLAAWTRGKRRKCFPPEEADLGYGGTDKSAYYGISLMLCVTGSGVITGLVTAPANNAERWSLSALLAWRHDPTVVPMGIEAIATAAKHGRTLVGPVGHRLSPATAGPAVTDVYLADPGERAALAGAMPLAHQHHGQDLTVTHAGMRPPSHGRRMLGAEGIDLDVHCGQEGVRVEVHGWESFHDVSQSANGSPSYSSVPVPRCHPRKIRSRRLQAGLYARLVNLSLTRAAVLSSGVHPRHGVCDQEICQTGRCIESEPDHRV